jgi:hypothetical protein
MSDVNIIIDSAPVSIEAADAPVSVNVESAPIEISAEAAPIEINIESAPIEIEVSGARGPAGISDVTTEWFYLIGSWTEEPTLNATTPALGGVVYDYTYGSTVYFRHIPEPYNPTSDTFYETYSAGILSNPISSRGVAI